MDLDVYKENQVMYKVQVPYSVLGWMKPGVRLGNKGVARCAWEPGGAPGIVDGEGMQGGLPVMQQLGTREVRWM